MALSNGIILDCDYWNLRWATRIAYSCYPYVIPTGSNRIEQVIGHHTFGRTNADVLGLDIWNEELTFVPRNIHEFFPNIRMIRFVHTGLSSISADDFKPFPQLIEFFSDFNPVTSLDGDLFKHNPGIRYLDFHSNGIEEIGPGFMSHLPALESSDFRHNLCVDFFAETVAEIQQLELLLAKCLPSDDRTPTPTEETTVTTPAYDPSGVCAASCMEHFEFMDKKVIDLKEIVDQQDETIKSLASELQELKVYFTNQMLVNKLEAKSLYNELRQSLNDKNTMIQGYDRRIERLEHVINSCLISDSACSKKLEKPPRLSN